MKDILQFAKVRTPALPPSSVVRSRIFRILSESRWREKKAILVSAPAGFGKTTCILQWLTEEKPAHAWVTLEPQDDDPGIFFEYLILALQQIHPDIGQEVVGILRAGSLPPMERLAASLSNDILEKDEPFLLVLDDFHNIQDEAILSFMGRLLSGPDLPLHLVLISREDPPLPLANLRAKNQLFEIRVGDLRFQREEMKILLANTLNLALEEPEFAMLEQKTEGWAAGLHLAGISLRECESRSRFLETWKGSDRHILDYLVEEVLRVQSAEMRKFLFRTSILARMNADLCQAVTGRADSATMLDRIYRSNLFLIPMGDSQEWCRYHPLFRDILLDQLQKTEPEVISDLHASAGKWFEQHGMPDEAIQHYVEGRAFDQAVRLMESHALDLLLQWHVKTVDGWIRAVPPDWSRQSIRANLAFAWVQLMRRMPAKAFPFIQRLEELFADPESVEAADPSLRGKWMAIQAMLLQAQQKTQDSILLGNRALQIVPPGDSLTGCMIQLGIANAYRDAGEAQKALDALRQVVEYGAREGNIVYELLGASGMALYLYEGGKLHEAHAISMEAIRKAEANRLFPPICMAIYGELGVVEYAWHRLENARAYSRQAIQTGLLSGFNDAKLFYCVLLSRIHQMEGDLEQAFQTIEEAAALMERQAAVVVREEVVGQRVRMYLAFDRLTEAEAILAREGVSPANLTLSPGGHASKPFHAASGAIYAGALRVLLSRADRRGEREALPAGISFANEVIKAAHENGYPLLEVEFLILRARFHAAGGENSRALDDYRAAVALAEPEFMASIFLEEGEPVALGLESLLSSGRLTKNQKKFVESILRFFVEYRTASSPNAESSQDVLSAREREVLRLISDGLSYEEVAETLVVSLNTVRSHIKAIYGKLRVNNRMKAIEAASRQKLM